MSLLERIAKRAPPDARSLSLPDLLAETALVSLHDKRDTRTSPAIARHFTQVVLDENLTDTEIFVGQLLEQGVPVERIINKHIPATARHLGALWEEDTLDFAAVTRGCGHLMRMAHDLGWHTPASKGYVGLRPRALLVRHREEQHFLGLLVAAYQLRRAGWLVRLLLTEEENLAETLEAETFEIIGLSLAQARTMDCAADLIGTARPLSGDARFVVGGTLTEQATDKVEKLGADILIKPGEAIATALAPARYRPKP